MTEGVRQSRDARYVVWRRPEIERQMNVAQRLRQSILEYRCLSHVLVHNPSAQCCTCAWQGIGDRLVETRKQISEVFALEHRKRDLAVYDPPHQLGLEALVSRDS